MRKTLPQLLRHIRACTHCADVLPCGPRPVLQAHRLARLCIVGQAPGRKVHETGIPWNDPSGERLLTLLLGQYAQAYYLGDCRKATLGETVKAWKEYLPLGYLPLAHPSPPNQPWLVKNPWFEEELVRELQSVIQALKL